MDKYDKQTIFVRVVGALIMLAAFISACLAILGCSEIAEPMAKITCVACGFYLIILLNFLVS